MAIFGRSYAQLKRIQLALFTPVVAGHSGAFAPVLPPPKTGLTAVIAHVGGFTITLPPPVTGLSATIAHIGGFSVVIPPPKTGLSATIAHIGGFTPVLPPPKTGLTAVIAHIGSFTPVLPPPKTVFNLTLIGHVGSFAPVLPRPLTSLSATVGHVGPLGILVPAPVMSLTGTDTSSGHESGVFQIRLPVLTAWLEGVVIGPTPNPFTNFGWTDQELKTRYAVGDIVGPVIQPPNANQWKEPTPFIVILNFPDTGLTLGDPVTMALVAGGGSGVYTWSVVAGALPPGLFISGSQILGTPSARGGYTAAIQAIDTNGYTDIQVFTFAVG